MDSAGGKGLIDDKWFKVKTKHKKVPEAPELVLFEMGMLSKDIAFLMDKLRRQFDVTPHQRTWLPAFTLAKQYLRENQLIPIPTDMDGRYALVEKRHYYDLVGSGLAMPKNGVLPECKLNYEQRIKIMHKQLLKVELASDAKKDGLCRWSMKQIRNN